MTGLSKITNFLLKISIVFLILSNFHISNLKVKAEDELLRGLTISPVILEVEADLGKAYTVPLQVFNDTKEDKKDLFTDLQTFEASGQEGVPQLRDFKPEEVERSWINFSENKFELKAGETKTININLNISEKASPGSYFFATIVGTKNQDSLSDSSLAIEHRLSALLFLNIRGNVDRKITIQKFSPTLNIADPFFDSIILETKIAISGNSFLRPSGQISNFQDGQKVETSDLNSKQKIILPNSSRDFSQILQSPIQFNFLPSWIVRTSATEKNDSSMEKAEFKRPWVGSQNIKLDLIYANSQGQMEILEGNTKIFFFPWKTLLIVLLIGFLTLTLYYMIKKRFLVNKKL